ncbi:MAG: hypothetical protein QM612_02250 [Thermomonas sp.]|uniref:hypothetical protein n=1 Tax=Thermomonas sp. TaxID=1971895 RepID=UPI0039E46CE8
MPRVLACLDETPAQDGSCAYQAWVDQASFSDFLPTHEQANAVGVAFLGALVVVAFVKRAFKPQR